MSVMLQLQEKTLAHYTVQLYNLRTIMVFSIVILDPQIFCFKTMGMFILRILAWQRRWFQS